MKALLCTRYGTPDDLELADIDEPKAGSGEVVVKIHAAALNFFDTLIIAGKYQFKPAPPFSPAAEFAGTVESLGAGVTSVKIGERVIGYMTYGAARERVAIAADKLIRMPDALDFDRAAGVCITYGTTLHALKDRAAAEIRRDARRARCIGRRRFGRDRTRQDHGRARDRLRVIG